VEVILEKPVDLTKALILVVELTRGHGESKRKMDTVSAAWRKKLQEARETRKPFTSKCPSWLQRRGDKYVFRKGAEPLLKRIFALSAAGHGCRAVAATFNREKVPTWEATTQHWPDTLIRRIVRGREVLGEFQPKTRDASGKKRADGEPIIGYYPAAVTEAEWHAAKLARERRKDRGGRPAKEAKLTNLFTGLLHDGKSGDKLITWNRHKQKVLVPHGFIHHGNEGASFPLVPFERAVLSQLREIEPAELLGTGDGPDEVAELKAKLARVDAVLRSLADQYDDPQEEVPVITQKVKAKNAERKALVAKIEEQEAKAASPLSAVWGEMKGIIEVLDNTPPARLPEVRLRLKGLIARIVESVTCVFGGTTRFRWAAVRVQFTKEEHRDYLICHKIRNGRNTLPATTWTASGLGPNLKDERDLRKRHEAAQIEKHLAGLDLEMLLMPLTHAHPNKDKNPPKGWRQVK
jgi:hypothetical protein